MHVPFPKVSGSQGGEYEDACFQASAHGTNKICPLLR